MFPMRIILNIETPPAEELPQAGIWSEGELTGSSSNIDDNLAEEEKKGFLGKFKKSKKEKDETPTEQNVKTYPKNSTKDLIFLHGEDKSNAKTTRRDKKQNTNISEEEQLPLLKPQIKPVVDTMGLPPLDEIKVPELIRGGYSIHSEYYGEVNDGDPSLQY